MINIKYLSLDNSIKEKESENIELSCVQKEDIQEHIIGRVIKWQLANRRLGTKNIKNEGEVSGSGAKPYKQKGSGRARRGSRVSAGQRGGGFPHKPATVFTQKLNKKIRKIGLNHAVSNRYYSDSLKVISSEGSNLELSKTKESAVILKQIFNKERVLFVIPSDLKNLKIQSFINSCRNLFNIEFLPAAGLNVYDILKNDKLVIFHDAIKEVEKRICIK